MVEKFYFNFKVWNSIFIMFSWLGYNEWFAKTRQFIFMLCCFKTSSLIGAFGNEFIQLFHLFSASWITKTVSVSIEVWECPSCTRSDDIDGNERTSETQKSLISKITSLHVHPTFFAHFFAIFSRLRRENFMFYEGRKLVSIW